MSCCSLVLSYCSPFSDLSPIQNSGLLVIFHFWLLSFFMPHNHLIIFPFCRYIHSHGYIYKQVMYDRISLYIDHSAPICVTSSLLRLLCLLWYTLEYHRDSVNSVTPKFGTTRSWGGATHKLKPSPFRQLRFSRPTPCSVLPLNRYGQWKWTYCFFYPVVIVPLLYMLEPAINTLRMEQKITSRTKGMQGNLKMGDRWQEWIGIVTKVVSHKQKNASYLWIVYNTILGHREEEWRVKRIGKILEMWNVCECTSIKEFNSLGTPWGPESIRKRYNTLKKYFQCIWKCPDPLGDLPQIYLVIVGGKRLVPVLVWMQDRYPGLYACINEGNTDGKW